MNESLRAQIDTYLSRLNDLKGRGRQLGDALARDPSNGSLIAATRAWQEQCGITINQLSGGSKAHWLARKYRDNRESGPETPVSERDARLTGQVLNVVMRDLNPGR